MANREGRYFRDLDHLMTRTAAWQLLQNFHALEYPGLHVQLNHPDYGRPIDALLVDRGRKDYEKLGFMRQFFMPVARALFPDAEPGEPYTLRTRVANYCQQEIRPGDEYDFRTPGGVILRADAILPEQYQGQDLLWSMYSTWKNSESAWCKPLQRYIGEKLADVTIRPIAS